MKGSGLAPIDDETVHVFGRNLADRVVESKPEDDDHNNKKEEERKDREKEDDVEAIKKRKFETITGEEGEETVFQGDFKMFVWDKSTSNWIEKGRGQLKLNDTIETHESKSRLIMRAGGTYRIILNVAIQHSFFKVIAITKTSIRFTDSQNVWAASGSNAKELGDLIDERLKLAPHTGQDATGDESETEEKQPKDHNRETDEQSAEAGEAKKSAEAGEAKQSAEAGEAKQSTEAVEAKQSTEAVEAKQPTEAGEAKKLKLSSS